MDATRQFTENCPSVQYSQSYDKTLDPPKTVHIYNTSPNDKTLDLPKTIHNNISTLRIVVTEETVHRRKSIRYSYLHNMHSKKDMACIGFSKQPQGGSWSSTV